MKRLLLTLPLLLAMPAAAQQADPVTPASVVAQARADEWRTIAPEDLLVMDLAPDAAGRARRVVIQLMPAPFSQPWVENVRTLARAHWWDGTQVYRVVDNWVAQWGAGEQGGEDGGEAGFAVRPLPEGVVSPVAPYVVDVATLADHTPDTPIAVSEPTEQRPVPVNQAGKVTEVIMWPTPFEHLNLISIDATQTRLTEQGWHDRDAYTPWVEFWQGWPLGNAEVAYWVNEHGEQVEDPGRRPPPLDLAPPYKVVDRSEFWPLHCYGSVGVARGLAPDTGTGAELYAVIGHAPRQLDRNIAVVGRVIAGIEHLSTLPRGTAEAGVYATRGEDTPIISVRLGSDMADPPRFEYLATTSESFARYVAVRANRNDAFYTVPAGGVDICNVQVPIRSVAG